MLNRLFQVNLQQSFGGGEVYTASLCRALDQLGVCTTLLCHPEADFWRKLSLPASCKLIAVNTENLAAQLPEPRCWLLTHGPIHSGLASRLSQKHLLTAIAHMPPQAALRIAISTISACSAFPPMLSMACARSTRRRGMPLYGVADMLRSSGSGPIQQQSRFDWDRRKGRDRILGWLEPFVEPLRSRPLFTPRPGITLGIVSRLTPIKQFPALFEILAPVLAAQPQYNVEIFGSGGYASVRDLKLALRPISNRVRFWGQQRNVAAIYAQIDYLLTGLPEKEALGLNVIEAQACGTPVIAVNAPPFTETVIDGRSGFLYCDPRQDSGVDFARLLKKIADTRPIIDPRLATEHLARFSFASFVDRLRPIVEWVSAELGATR